MWRYSALELARGRLGERSVASNRWIATEGQIQRNEGKQELFISTAIGI